MKVLFVSLFVSELKENAFYPAAAEIPLAFRGKLPSLLALSRCGVSPMLFIPQESRGISSANGVRFKSNQ